MNTKSKIVIVILIILLLFILFILYKLTQPYKLTREDLNEAITRCGCWGTLTASDYNGFLVKYNIN